MVVVSGVAGDPAGSSAAVLDAASTGQVRLAIGDAQLSELVRVFGDPEIEELTKSTVRAFEVGLDIGYMGIMHHPRRLDRPSLADPKDSSISLKPRGTWGMHPAGGLAGDPSTAPLSGPSGSTAGAPNEEIERIERRRRCRMDAARLSIPFFCQARAER